jgi:hypothetical protein
MPLKTVTPTLNSWITLVIDFLLEERMDVVLEVWYVANESTVR